MTLKQTSCTKSIYIQFWLKKKKIQVGYNHINRITMIKQLSVKPFRRPPTHSHTMSHFPHESWTSHKRRLGISSHKGCVCLGYHVSNYDTLSVVATLTVERKTPWDIILSGWHSYIPCWGRVVIMTILYTYLAKVGWYGRNDSSYKYGLRRFGDTMLLK